MTGDPADPDNPLHRVLQSQFATWAALAPSVHNVQPTRWRFGPHGWVTCYHMRERSLPHGDPTGRDVRISVGASIEGMALACSAMRYRIEVHAQGDDGSVEAWGSKLGPVPTGLRPVALLRMVPGGGDPDPLVEQVRRRKSWRGTFAGDASVQLAALRHEDLFVIPREHLDRVARWHDDATWHFEQRPAYHAELWKWLRLSPGHPDWARDGLNADALVLSKLERRAASLLLRPRVFAALGRLGIARTLVSEAAAVRSATALLVFAPPATLDDWSVGRRFYRAWLTATRAGLALAPMSALADWDDTRASITELATVPADRRVVNVFRAGLPPVTAQPDHARLPDRELIV